MCSRTIDGLADEITELASHIHAATCRWLGLVAEFDNRGGWSDWGCRSCAHWLSWRCSISPVAAREHVRVAHRLQELPLIRGAFAEGRLSYSQVRALTRVENVAKEEELLSLARHATAAHLERLVRAYRGVVARTRATVGGGPERYVTWSHADDGSLLLHARLPAEEGAVVLAALQAGVESLAEGASAEEPAGLSESASAEAPAVSSEIADAARADASEFVEAASAEAPQSAETASAEAPQSAESASAEAPAASSEVGEAAPPDSSEFAETASAEAAPRVSELRADALVLMADTLLANEPSARGGDRYQVVVHVDAASLRDGSDESELADGAPIAAETARRLACDAALVPLLERAGKPLSVGRKTRSIPPALRRALASRDRGCRFPGCTNHRTVDAHHIEHWANGGATSLDNLVELCRHHHRLLHEGGYTVARAGASFVFRRPDGRQIRPVPRPPRGCSHALRDSNNRGRRPIDPEATVTLWAGERFDLGFNVDALLTFAPPEAPGI
jgi:hypothetical protein